MTKQLVMPTNFVEVNDNEIEYLDAGKVTLGKVLVVLGVVCGIACAILEVWDMKIFNDKIVLLSSTLLLSVMALILCLRDTSDMTWVPYVIIPLMVITLGMVIYVYIKQGIKEKKRDKENK